jgi:hypothetical protein
MADPVEVRATLDRYAEELDKASQELGQVERILGGYIAEDGSKVEGIEAKYNSWVDNFEVGLWTAHADDGAKLPSADMRQRMARKQMPAELLGQYERLLTLRAKHTKRIREIKALLSAQQTLMGALKAELEASR